MTKNTKDSRQSRPQVALLVETSLGSGRDILRGLARGVREFGPWALYHEPRSLEESVPHWLRHWQGDGIIARIQNEAIAEAVHATGLPTVDVLGVVADSGFPLVHVDDAAIARAAAEHLIERGFRYFGYFGIDGENWSERRRDALATTLCEAGLSLEIYELPRHAIAENSWESVENDLAAWIARLPQPAGVMVCSDQRGPQFLEACRRAGVSVPDEVAVIGVDDDEPLCEVCNPPLTSVNPAHHRVGHAAARLLARLMAGKAAPREPVLIQPAGVTTRLSTEVLAIEDRPLATALRLIREQACDGLDVDAIARHIGLSRSVLQRRFRSSLNRSVHQEILQARLRRAMDLLAASELSLAEVAERTGFKHQEYLGAVFKARTGKTPAEFRRQRRG